LKKFDEEKSIKIDEYKFVNNEFQIKFKYPLLKKDKVIVNSITAIAKEVPQLLMIMS
jgi:hypothetical protein